METEKEGPGAGRERENEEGRGSDRRPKAESEKHRQKLNMKDPGWREDQDPFKSQVASKRRKPTSQKEDERGQRSSGENPSVSPESAQCQQLVLKTAGGITAVLVSTRSLHHPSPDLSLPPKCCRSAPHVTPARPVSLLRSSWTPSDPPRANHSLLVTPKCSERACVWVRVPGYPRLPTSQPGVPPDKA